MRVLVTGGCGFIGSHVCEFYRGRGDSVVSYDNMTKVELQRTQYAVERARDYNWDYLKQLGVEMVKADIRDYEALLEAAKGADYIVHTAAQPAVTISMEDVDLDFSTNVLGTLNVLQDGPRVRHPGRVLRDHPRLRQPDQRDPDRGGDALPAHARRDRREPSDHGGAADAAARVEAVGAELYLQVFIDTYKVRAASYRLTGLYGPRQLGGEDHGWVANFSIRTLLGWPLNVYGTGKQVRDILFATDVAEAFHAFYEHQVPGIYNIGGGMRERHLARRVHRSHRIHHGPEAGRADGTGPPRRPALFRLRQREGEATAPAGRRR